ncbi:conserved Plasmodium protein, unknown function [Plasmodium malariae]|uniref:GRAM domain-containing protein n=1 Tax=Plasmodium malariae TaxID=5858 RepID=A0A1C3KLC4_PLAMA|nr:conserved Plasmodium protein, unknown function [Plasmodium malariae]
MLNEIKNAVQNENLNSMNCYNNVNQGIYFDEYVPPSRLTSDVLTENIRTEISSKIRKDLVARYKDVCIFDEHECKTKEKIIGNVQGVAQGVELDAQVEEGDIEVKEAHGVLEVQVEMEAQEDATDKQEEVKEAQMKEKEEIRELQEVKELEEVKGQEEVEELEEVKGQEEVEELEEVKEQEEVEKLEEVKGQEMKKQEVKELQEVKETQEEVKDAQEVKEKEEVKDAQEVKEKEEVKDAQEVKEKEEVKEAQEKAKETAEAKEVQEESKEAQGEAKSQEESKAQEMTVTEAQTDVGVKARQEQKESYDYSALLLEDLSDDVLMLIKKKYEERKRLQSTIKTDKFFSCGRIYPLSYVKKEGEPEKLEKSEKQEKLDKVDILDDKIEGALAPPEVSKETRRVSAEGSLIPDDSFTYRLSAKEDFDAIVRSSISTYSCALSKKILIQGKICITHDSVYFISLFNAFFSKNSVVRINYDAIQLVEKISSFHFIPNALKVVTKNKSFLFTSFVHRDHAYNVINDMIRNYNNVGEIPKKGIVIDSNEELVDDDDEEIKEDVQEEIEEKYDHEQEKSVKAREGTPNIEEGLRRTNYIFGGNLKEADEQPGDDVTNVITDKLDRGVKIESRKNALPMKISSKEEDILKEKKYIQCNNHIDSLYIHEYYFKQLFLDIFSKFDNDNPLVRNVLEKNPKNLNYDNLRNLDKIYEQNKFFTCEFLYNVSLFDDDKKKKVFGMPSRSNVKEKLSFFFFENSIIIQKVLVLLCNVPLAGCFHTVVTVHMHNVVGDKGNQVRYNNEHHNNTHIDFFYDISFVKHTFFKGQIKSNAMPELEKSLINLKRYTSEAIKKRYKKCNIPKKEDGYNYYYDNDVVHKTERYNAMQTNEDSRRPIRDEENIISMVENPRFEIDEISIYPKDFINEMSTVSSLFSKYSTARDSVISYFNKHVDFSPQNLTNNIGNGKKKKKKRKKRNTTHGRMCIFSESA